MAKTFRSYEPDQMLLLPPSLQDWVPEGHLARFISDMVDSMGRLTLRATWGTNERRPCPVSKARDRTDREVQASATRPSVGPT